MTRLFYLLLISCLISCSIRDGNDYVGYWQSNNFYLTVDQYGEYYYVSIMPFQGNETVYDYRNKENQYFICEFSSSSFCEKESEEPIVFVNQDGGLSFKGINVWRTNKKEIQSWY